MKVSLTPNLISGEIIAPSSKSYGHRVIISAFLSGERVKIENAGNSDDINATVNALNALGGNLTLNGGTVISSGKNKVNGLTVVNCGESGSTLRFLMPIACALGINAKFIGKGKLLSRPIGDLAFTLESGGVTVSTSEFGHEVKGKLKSGRYEINAGVSSQYITGMLFALTLLDGDSTLILNGTTVSAPYIDITLSVLESFGVKIQKIENGFFIKGGQKYIAPTFLAVEGDFSGAAFILSLGAIKGEVTVKGLNLNTRQGDKEILTALEKFGASVTRNDGSVTVKSNRLNAITVDCEDIPDLVQVLSAVASYASGVTVLKNVDRLRLKESDRILAVINTLKAAGITAWYENSNLYIQGGIPLGGTFDGGKDHRTVMSAVVLSAYAKGSSIITGAEAHQKSYPEFFNHLTLLGANINVEV